MPMASMQDKFVGEGLTYDDVLLVPNYSEVLPREVKPTNLSCMEAMGMF